jgi:acetylornithine deacetylase/succinyl-diaminopimelate desuccinylase-like protein
MLEDVLKYADANKKESLNRLFDILRIKSISTDPNFKEDVKQTANHIAKELESIGFDVTIYPTQGHPMLVAHYGKAKKTSPHCLFYGHYDVQPVDPIELWDSDPFDPQLVKRDDGTEKIVARGAADDKGQIMTFIEAMRYWIVQEKELPVPVTILLEGEEESGSPSLPEFMKEHGHVLKDTDVVFVCDTNMWDRDTPAMTTRLRGLMGEEITITAANKDLHSGYFGGAAQNPIHILTSILGSLHDKNGRVTLPGFYEGVNEVSNEIKDQWQNLDFNEENFLGSVGLNKPAGEKGRSVLEQIWARPTLEINGISGGYTGKGFKTVIPSQASAKVSCRLVGDQDPDSIRKSLRNYINSHIPDDCSVEFQAHGGSPGIELKLNPDIFQKIEKALENEWDRKPVQAGVGGSIPIVGVFQKELGLDAFMIGFGLDDDQIHSPNEKYELSSYYKGIRSWIRILDALGQE